MSSGGGDDSDAQYPRRRRRAPLFLFPPLLLPLLLLLAAPRPSDAGIHVSHVIQDGRALIPLSPNFGFDPRGGGGVVATIRAPLVVYRPHPPPSAAAGEQGLPPPPDREFFVCGPCRLVGGLLPRLEREGAQRRNTGGGAAASCRSRAHRPRPARLTKK